MRRTALVVAATLATVLLSASAAGAHAEVRESDPRAGGVAPTDLDELDMVFLSMDPTEPVDISVTGPAGDDVTSGEAVVGEPTPSGVPVSVALQPLDAGLHTVTWRAMSSDGDGVSTGSFEFTAEAPGGSVAGVWLLWIVALGVPAAIFLRPGARRRRAD